MKTNQRWKINWNCCYNDSESFNRTFETKDSARNFMASFLKQERANFYNDSEYQEGEIMPVVLSNDGMTVTFKDGPYVFGILKLIPE